MVLLMAFYHKTAFLAIGCAQNRAILLRVERFFGAFYQQNGLLLCVLPKICCVCIAKFALAGWFAMRFGNFTFLVFTFYFVGNFVRWRFGQIAAAVNVAIQKRWFQLKLRLAVGAQRMFLETKKASKKTIARIFLFSPRSLVCLVFRASNNNVRSVPHGCTYRRNADGRL